MKRIAIYLATLLAALNAAAAHPFADVSVEVNDTLGLITVGFTVDPADVKLTSGSELRLTPLIASADTTTALEPLILAGRTRLLTYERGMRRTDGSQLFRAGRGPRIVYRRTAPWHGVDATVSISEVKEGCCGKTVSDTAFTVAAVNVRPARLIDPSFYRVPDVKAVAKIQELKGSAYVDFPVNRTVILPDYRNNRLELGKILASINAVRSNPDATITDISIKGYASPEGSYENNARLAAGRTEALTAYVKSRHDFAATDFHTDCEPENWAALRDSVAVSVVPDAAGIIGIIDSDLPPDAKEAEIKSRYPADYEFLRTNVYPALRRSDYVVRYTIRQFDDPAEIRRVYRERPSSLNLHELMILAADCTPGSAEFNDVMATAVRLYPDDRRCALNAAAAAIDRGDTQAAAYYLGLCRPDAETDRLHDALRRLQAGAVTVTYLNQSDK